MKTAFFLILSSFFFVYFSNLHAQGFTPPAEGKAVVYFVRVTNFGKAVSFQYFHNDKFIGQFKGKNYMRYECDPGEQLFWVSSEDKEFVTTELKAGDSYAIVINVEMGAWKARVGLNPLDPSNEKELLDRVSELINKKAPIVTSQKDMDKINGKLEAKNFIPTQLKRYETEWSKEKDFPHISNEMAIPQERLQK